MTSWETVKEHVITLNKLLIDKGGESYGFPLGEVPDSLYQLLADAIDKSEIYSYEEFLPYFEQLIGDAGEWDYQKLGDLFSMSHLLHTMPADPMQVSSVHGSVLEEYDRTGVVPTEEEALGFLEEPLEDPVFPEDTGELPTQGVGELPPQVVDTDSGLLTVPPVTTNMIPGMTGQFGSWSWLDYWGDVNPAIDDFFEEWVDRYNTESGAEFFNEEAFLNEFRYGENGINTQPWWRDVANGFKDHLQFWYSSGGRGTLGSNIGSLEPTGTGIGAGITGNPYNRAMDEFRELARAAIVDFMGEEFLLDGTITEQDITRYANKIMSSGGATYKLGKGIELNPENFANKANQVVQKELAKDFVGEDGQFLKPEKDFGPGSVTKLINEWKVLAKKQFMDIPENQLREWAMDVKTETGLTTEMVEQKINEMAFSRVDFPFTPEEREDYASRGTTMQELLQPQYSAVVGPYGWNDSSIQPDDPWLMDNYMFVDDNGNRRFRTAAEMRNHSRTNMERFQHSPVAQNFFNDFITKTASMFRSDY
jgi:hypothetical protein